MNLQELRQLKSDKKIEVRNLLETNKVNEAEALMEEVRGLDSQIKIA